MYKSLDNYKPFSVVSSHQFKAINRQNTYSVPYEKDNTSVCFNKQGEQNQSYLMQKEESDNTVLEQEGAAFPVVWTMKVEERNLL